MPKEKKKGAMNTGEAVRRKRLYRNHKSKKVDQFSKHSMVA